MLGAVELGLLEILASRLGDDNSKEKNSNVLSCHAPNPQARDIFPWLWNCDV